MRRDPPRSLLLPLAVRFLFTPPARHRRHRMSPRAGGGPPWASPLLLLAAATAIGGFAKSQMAAEATSLANLAVPEGLRGAPYPPPTNERREVENTCEPDEFQCLHLNLNQILTINDWNRRDRECIPQSYRCDGRHDCQDGSDEVECFVQLPKRKTFRCYVGVGDESTPEDCFQRDRDNPEFDPRETSRSVSEMKEWVCSKIDRPDGSTTRDCMKMYTGGEAFRVCYTSFAEGSTCLCSSELCNGGAAGADRVLRTTVTTLVLALLVTSIA